MKLSVIVPAFNEEARIGKMLDQYLPYLRDKYSIDVELIVVVNGSTDRTSVIVEEYALKCDFLKILVEPRPVGKGGALMQGFEAASGDLIGFVDADGSTPPEAFDQLVQEIGDAGAIIASRWRKESIVTPRQPFKRRIASRVFNILTRVMFGLRLTDTQCGAKLMKRDVLMKIMPHLGITRWAFDVDLLYHIRSTGEQIKEIPTEWHDVEGSKIEVARVSSEMAAALVRLRLLHSPFSWIVTLYNRFLAPILNPPGFERDYLIRHSLVLLSGSILSGVVNLAFQIAMVRMVGNTNQAGFGVLATMLGLYWILNIPINALGRTVSHYTAGYLKDGSSEKVRGMVTRITRDISLVLIPLFALSLFSRDSIAGFLRMDRTLPLLVVLLTFFVGVYRAIFGGALIGFQAFFLCSMLGVAWSVVRLGLAVVLVMWGLGADGGIVANGAAVLVGLVLAVAAYVKVSGAGPSDREMEQSVYRYFLKHLLVLAPFTLMVYMDLVLVKHYFDPDTAGLYGIAVTVARIVFFLPIFVTGAMFPKVVSAGKVDQRTWRTLIKALFLVACIVFSVAVLFTIFPGIVIRLLKGTTSPELEQLVRYIVWALSSMSFVNVIMNFELAQRRFKIAVPLWICVALFVGGVAFMHSSLLEVVKVMIGAGFLAMILSIVSLPWKEVGLRLIKKV